jgi:hypothetical protein
MKILSLITLLLIANSTFAQKQISGIVTDPDGRIVMGCNVLIKGTPTGTVTNSDGFFTINIDGFGDSITLVFALIGYEQAEKTFSTDETTTDLKIILKPGKKKKRNKSKVASQTGHTSIKHNS